MIPIELYNLTEKVRRYGTIDYDKETEENGNHYRTTHYLLERGLYAICWKNGEILSFNFYVFP